MSAKCFSEQFTLTSLICSTSASLSLNQSISSLFICSSFALPFWSVFFFSVHFSSHHCHGSSICCCCGSTRKSLSPKTLRIGENGEERWGSGRARAEGEQTASSMSVLVSVPFSALQFYQLLIHGSAEVMALVAHQTHFHTALKKERTSLMTSGMHPQGINFAASGVDFTISAEFGCRLEGNSRFMQREYSFNQVYMYL